MLLACGARDGAARKGRRDPRRGCRPRAPRSQPRRDAERRHDGQGPKEQNGHRQACSVTSDRRSEAAKRHLVDLLRRAKRVAARRRCRSGRRPASTTRARAVLSLSRSMLRSGLFCARVCAPRHSGRDAAVRARRTAGHAVWWRHVASGKARTFGRAASRQHNGPPRAPLARIIKQFEERRTWRSLHNRHSPVALRLIRGRAACERRRPSRSEICSLMVGEASTLRARSHGATDHWPRAAFVTPSSTDRRRNEHHQAGLTKRRAKRPSEPHAIGS